MPDDPKAALQFAILQSLTAEAGGFYGLIVTVASSFLGGSLLFLEKFALNPTRWTLVLLILAWLALVAAIGCIARLRYHYLKSAKLALEDRFGDASKIDKHTDRLGWWSQYLLIGGMLGLVLVGSLTFYTQQGERKNEIMNEQKQPIATGNE
jgi:H+/Cl- antiporter ClcA